MLVALTETPLDLMDAATVDTEGNALDLNARTTYSVQAELPAGGGGSEYLATTGPFVHLHDRATAPATPSQGGRKLRHLETVRAKAGSGGNLWAWVTNGQAVINVFKDA